MKPILFNTECVRAFLDGRKTVTRRVVKQKEWEITGRPKWGNQCDDGHFWFTVSNDKTATVISIKPPYRPGDLLYVRETFRIDYLANVPGSGRVRYKADDTYADFRFSPERYEMMRRAQLKPGWRPNENMPKEAARLFLRVTNVRVERLQDVTDADARAEGVGDSDTVYYNGALQCEFAALWDSTIKKADLPRYGWEANPWCWVISFDRISKEEAQK